MSKINTEAVHIQNIKDSEVSRFITSACIQKLTQYINHYGKDNLLASKVYDTEMISTGNTNSLSDFIDNFQFEFLNWSKDK